MSKNVVQSPGNEGPLIELKGVTKHFGGTVALDNVGFDLRSGEIHALLGENGAGKSTLINILGGIHTPDAGKILIKGAVTEIRNVADANRYGISIIHQELSLAPNLSIAENIFLGREPSGPWGLRRRKMHEEARALVMALGLEEIQAVDTIVSQLSVAHQQLVEITRALSCRGRVLVLDEPTSALSEAETESLFAGLRQLRSQGVGIIYISHRLEEIMRLADRVTVLRDGRSVGTQSVDRVNQQQLIRWMVGRDIADHFHRPAAKTGRAALQVRNLRNPNIHDVSFDLHYGEILGIAGLVGSGRSELVRAIFGIDPLQKGQIIIDGKPKSIDCPRDALDNGMVLIPEDRKQQGLVMIQTVAFNIALPWVDQWITGCMPNSKKRRRIVDRAVNDFAVKVADVDQCIDALSGGNQQKVLVSRWMERRPKILILDEPTRGVDVGAREEMFNIIGSLVETGMAVLLISSDLSEVINCSHRVALYRDGGIIQTAKADEISRQEIIKQLTGALA
jgi:ABC-type sugar transport system ATPase subunit